MIPYLYMLITIVFAAAAQILMKYASLRFGVFPIRPGDFLPFLFNLFSNIYFLASLGSAFLCAIAWSLTLAKLPLSYAYPFMSLSYIVVIFASGLIFAEGISIMRWTGAFVICLGVAKNNYLFYYKMHILVKIRSVLLVVFSSDTPSSAFANFISKCAFFVTKNNYS